VGSREQMFPEMRTRKRHPNIKQRNSLVPNGHDVDVSDVSHVPLYVEAASDQ
jgi:hypothetical protein